MIRLATLFSGIGAIEQALSQMDIPFEIIFACDNGERELKLTKEEINKNILGLNHKEKKEYIDNLYKALPQENLMEKSYKANYHIKDENFYQDICFLDADMYRNQIDLLVGGSPCQAFSVNGKRGGFEDTRGTLFYEYARIIQETQPKVFIYENVKGMLNHDKGKTWDTIKNTFHQLNYNIFIHSEDGKESPILNAVDYGIPQKRERLFVIGFKNDLKLKQDFRFPKKRKLTKTIYNYLERKVDSKYYLGEKGFKFVTTHPSRARVGNNVMGCQKANQQFNWNGDFIFEDIKCIETRNDLANAHISEWNGKIGVIRKYTPRECLNLMGFSNEFNIVVNVLIELVKEIINTGVFLSND